MKYDHHPGNEVPGSGITGAAFTQADLGPIFDTINIPVSCTLPTPRRLPVLQQMGITTMYNMYTNLLKSICFGILRERMTRSMTTVLKNVEKSVLMCS
jgi:hypothetical protein